MSVPALLEERRDPTSPQAYHLVHVKQTEARWERSCRAFRLGLTAA